MSVILCITTSQVKPPTQKNLTVTLTLDQWNYVLDAIDKSNAPHANVKQILEWVTPQLNKQLSDTTKPKK